MKKGLIALAVVVVLVLAVAIGGFTYGYNLENDDAFCASCHTEPESTYYQRTHSSAFSDLASFHVTEGARCIDCHSGKGLTGRAGAMFTGTLDYVAYKTGTYQQPAQTTRPESNGSCTKCHSFSLIGGEAGEGRSIDGIRGHDGHYHTTRLLLIWRARGGPVNGCAACHPAHVEMPGTQFSNNDIINQGCDDCHAALGEGERKSD